MKKILKVYSGTDIVLCVPAHPLSQVVAIKRLIDKICDSDEKEFEVKVNSLEGLAMLKKYGDKKGIRLNYILNGTPSTYEDVIADLNRGWEFINND